tara:strand:- start:816 stop:1439 length:624 start_codon:yes stop_codon:yes gene_type:complete
MESNKMINQIKTLLNIEVKLEEMKLENGTRIEAESFEKGKEVFIITDDERVAMPVGEYILEDSRLLVVEEEGIIGDMREVSDEVPQKEEEETEDLEKEDDEEMGYEKKMKKMVELEERMKNLEDAVEDLKKEKIDASESALKSRTVKEEFSEEDKKEVEEKLSSEPAAETIKHNPEGDTVSSMKFTYSQNRIPTTLDRILNKINNIK